MRVIYSSALLVMFPTPINGNSEEQKKLTAINRENYGEHPRNSQARDTNVPRKQKCSIAQVSEEVEGRETKKLFQECSRKESRFLDALPQLGDFCLKPQVQVHSGRLEIR